MNSCCSRLCWTGSPTILQPNCNLAGLIVWPEWMSGWTARYARPYFTSAGTTSTEGNIRQLKGERMSANSFALLLMNLVALALFATPRDRSGVGSPTDQALIVNTVEGLLQAAQNPN